MGWTPFVACAALILSTGCDDAPALDGRSGEQSPAASADLDLDLDSDLDSDLDLAKRATRGRIVGGEKLARKVHAPPVTSANTDVRERLSDAARAGLGDAPAPVLVPRGGAWAELGQLHTGPTWAVFEAHENDLHVNISASVQARLHPEIRGTEFPDRLRARPAFVTRNEGIWSASWMEYGVAYAIEIECGDRADASACADDTRLRALAESLVYVGGGEQVARAQREVQG